MDARELCWRPERRPPLFCSEVMFLTLSYPCFVCVLLAGPSLHVPEIEFCKNSFPLVLVVFLGGRGGFVSILGEKSFCKNFIQVGMDL